MSRAVDDLKPRWMPHLDLILFWRCGRCDKALWLLGWDRKPFQNPSTFLSQQFPTKRQTRNHAPIRNSKNGLRVHPRMSLSPGSSATRRCGIRRPPFCCTTGYDKSKWLKNALQCIHWVMRCGAANPSKTGRISTGALLASAVKTSGKQFL